MLAASAEVWVISIHPGVLSRNLGLGLGERRVRPRFFHIALVVALLANIGLNTLWVASSFDSLKDLDSFLHSGAAYAHGLDPYRYYAWLSPEPISPEALNLNPPVSVYLFEPLTAVDRGLLGAAFLAGSLVMVGASIVLLMHAYPEKRHWLMVLIVLGMAGIWQMLWYLQIYAPLLLAMTGAWLLLRKGDWLAAGILIGLVVAVKPNYAIVALVLFAAGHYRPALAAAATAGLISLVPLLIDGSRIYAEWLHMTTGFTGYEWTSNASLVSVGERLDVDPIGKAAAAALALAVAVFAWRQRPAPLDAMALGLLAVILVGPVSWAGYTLLLLPYLFSIRWDGWTWVSIAILVTPFSPERSLGALGIDLRSLFEASSGGIGLPIPSPVPGTLAAVFLPLLGAIYAWGVILLLVRLWRQIDGQRVTTGRPALSRLALQTAALRAVRPAARPAPEAEARGRQRPAPVRVRYD